MSTLDKIENSRTSKDDSEEFEKSQERHMRPLQPWYQFTSWPVQEGDSISAIVSCESSWSLVTDNQQTVPFRSSRKA